MDVTSPHPLAAEPGRTADPGARSSQGSLRRALVGAALALCASGSASAYTATLNPASPQEIYLQVGVGSFTNDYIHGGQPGQNTTVNSVTATDRKSTRLNSSHMSIS